MFKSEFFKERALFKKCKYKIMGIVTPTPTPPPSNDNFFKQIEKLQANFSKEDNKIWTDVNKEYKKLKNKKSKTEQHEK